MKSRWVVLGVSFAVVICLVVESSAQQRRGGGGGMFGRSSSLLRTAALPEVATELNMTEEQVALAKRLADESRAEQRELFQGFRDLSQDERREKSQQFREKQSAKEKQLGEALGPDKLKRAQQLSWQAGGLAVAFFSRDISEKLNISGDQRQQSRDAFQGIRDEFTSAEGPEAREKVTAKLNEKLASILTEQQSATWKEMLGEPANGELLAKIRASGRRRRGGN